jgi:hypothetical protein
LFQDRSTIALARSLDWITDEKIAIITLPNLGPRFPVIFSQFHNHRLLEHVADLGLASLKLVLFATQTGGEGTSSHVPATVRPQNGRSLSDQRPGKSRLVLVAILTPPFQLLVANVVFVLAIALQKLFTCTHYLSSITLVNGFVLIPLP